MPTRFICYGKGIRSILCFQKYEVSGTANSVVAFPFDRLCGRMKGIGYIFSEAEEPLLPFDWPIYLAYSFNIGGCIVVIHITPIPPVSIYDASF